MANRQFYRIGVLTVLFWVFTQPHPTLAQEPNPEDWIQRLDQRWGIERYEQTRTEAFGFPIPLGPMEKVRGSWQLKRSTPVSGNLVRTTWQVRNTPVVELFGELSAALAEEYTLAYECSDRRCGNASEWASRVYNERLLYGRDEYLRYAAFKSEQGTWLTVFTAARTADRQYLHIDVITPR
ncbi:MAG: DUF4892 domain-containing protein [Halieaceae bacterium]|nr:DUF4892 domain-containing protein [Halieaceae bacterium]